jgi:hypothetical protein
VNRELKIFLVLAAIGSLGGCSNTRYITDKKSAELQHQMHAHRSGVKAGDILLSTASFILSVTLGSEFQVSASEKAFKHITIENESQDSLTVNMVTDIEWKDSEYCDIMGIVLPPKAHQKILVPYPAAYNIYFRTPYTEEQTIAIRTDEKHSLYKLKPREPEPPEVKEKD